MCSSDLSLVAKFICFPCFEINTVNLGQLHSLDECEKIPFLAPSSAVSEGGGCLRWLLSVVFGGSSFVRSIDV